MGESSIKKGESNLCVVQQIASLSTFLRTQKASDPGSFGVTRLLIASCGCVCSRRNEISHSPSVSLSLHHQLFVGLIPAEGIIHHGHDKLQKPTYWEKRSNLKVCVCAVRSAKTEAVILVYLRLANLKERKKSGGGGRIRTVCFECDARPGDPLDSGARWLIILLRGSELWFGATAEDAEIERRWEQREFVGLETEGFAEAHSVGVPGAGYELQSSALSIPYRVNIPMNTSKPQLPLGHYCQISLTRQCLCQYVYYLQL